MFFGSSLKMSELRYCCIVADDAGKTVRESRGNCPLQTVSVTGLIRDAVAQYTLVQSYVNPLEDAAIEAVYTFPLCEGVAVCGFEAEVDGRKIVGRVQEKVAAKKEYEAAKKAGKVASLLQEETPDTFQASVGNIPPSKTVAIRITLVSDIKQDAGENQVRFVMPTSIAPRYGYTSVEQSSSSINTSSTVLSVNIGCAMSKAITSIQSPSHTIEVHLGTSSSDASFSFQPNRAKVSLTADSLLDRDLVIIVQALGLDEPRALVERHPKDGTHAISLTFTPRFALNPIRSLELIFIVDRSGSMGGTPIRKAGAALELFLRSIPVEDHYFNVIGFGSSHQALFPKSVAYNAESLKKGALYAQRMQADMGGTEMRTAFEEAFRQRRRDVPMQIFLLTDGEIWGVESLCEIIREAVDEGEKKSSSVRVFSLGIGDSVSHNLIESVARAGGGYAQLVMESERMEKKVLNMLKSALVPPASNLGVQWTSEAMAPADEAEEFVLVEAQECSRGEEDSAPAPPVVAPDEGDSTNKTPINLFSTSPEVPSPPPPPPAVPPPDVVVPIHQAPFRIPILCRGARFTVYALLSSTVPVPEELVLQGSSPDGPLELKVKTEKVQDGETMLHSLAARAIVRDLEEGASCIHALGKAPTATPTQKEMLKRLGVHVVDSEGKKYTNAELSAKHVAEITKEQILDIAMRYHLSSKCTSWVAIDEDTHQSIVHDKFEAGSQRFSSRSCAFGAPMMQRQRMCSAPSNFASPVFGSAMPMGQMAAPSNFAPRFGRATEMGQMAAPLTFASPVFGSAMPMGQMAAPSNFASSFGSAKMTAPMAAPSNFAFGSVAKVAPMAAPMAAPMSCQDVETFESPAAECLDMAFDGAGSEDEEFSAAEEKCDSYEDALGFSLAPEAVSTDDSALDESFIYTASSTPSAPTFQSSHFGSGAQHQFEGDQSEEPMTATDPHSRLRSILQHQSFDGSFPLVPEIAAFFSTTMEDLNGKLAEARKQCAVSTLSESEWETIWATCLAVEFMKKQLPELRDEWELVVEKAEKRVDVLLRNVQDVAAIKEAAAVVATADGSSASSTTVALGDVVDIHSAPEVAVLPSLIGTAEPEITPPSLATAAGTDEQRAGHELETKEAVVSDIVKPPSAPEIGTAEPRI